MQLGFLGLLTILFITLKLTAVITWSWVWVLAPLWAPVAVVVILFILGLFLADSSRAMLLRRRR
jgi:hypothetical protein